MCSLNNTSVTFKDYQLMKHWRVTTGIIFSCWKLLEHISLVDIDFISIVHFKTIDAKCFTEQWKPKASIRYKIKQSKTSRKLIVLSCLYKCVLRGDVKILWQGVSESKSLSPLVTNCDQPRDPCRRISHISTVKMGSCDHISLN